MEDLLERWVLLDELGLEDEEDFHTHIPLPMLDESAEEDGGGGGGDSPPANAGDGSNAPADPNASNTGAPTGDS